MEVNKKVRSGKKKLAVKKKKLEVKKKVRSKIKKLEVKNKSWKYKKTCRSKKNGCRSKTILMEKVTLRSHRTLGQKSKKKYKSSNCHKSFFS